MNDSDVLAYYVLGCGQQQRPGVLADLKRVGTSVARHQDLAVQRLERNVVDPNED
jgi:hypothetical protein